MAPIKLLNLLAVTSLVILATSFGPSPVNAVSVDSHRFARNTIRAHGTISKKKRASGKRCKNRPAGSGGNNNNNSSPSSTTPPPTQSSAPQSSQPANGGDNKPPPPPPSGGSGKKSGLAWPNGDDPSLSKYKAYDGMYVYTWAPQIPNDVKTLGFTPVPMLWGERQIDDFQKLVVAGYANIVLGFNEPNQAGQSDMSPQRGAELWKQYIQPLKAQGYKLVSPATTSAPSGMQWMKDFFAACDGCTFDAVAIHYYDVTSKGMIDYMTDFHNTFGKPIWATEFACQNFNGGPQCTRDQVFAFANEVTAFMDSTDWVEAYFPFGVMHDMQGVNQDNQLMAGDGSPTDLAKVYLL